LPALRAQAAMASEDLGPRRFEHLGIRNRFFDGGKYSKFGSDGYGEV
jgi:hypothetical protein